MVGRFVGGMIRRSTRARLRNLWWNPPQRDLTPPVILYANHHGWLDGYLMFHAVTKLGLRSLDWIEEFDAFPLFAKVGGMRFARNDAMDRAKTIRRTIRLMRTEKRSLVLFPEGTLHRPPGLLPFQPTLDLMARSVPGVSLVPVAILYEQSMHERPEAWLGFGEPHDFVSLEDAQVRVESGLADLRQKIADDFSFPVLATGTADVNERWDMRRMKRP